MFHPEHVWGKKIKLTCANWVARNHHLAYLSWDAVIGMFLSFFDSDSDWVRWCEPKWMNFHPVKKHVYIYIFIHTYMYICIYTFTQIYTRWFKATFLIPDPWSFSPLKSSLNHRKKVTLNHKVHIYTCIYIYGLHTHTHTTKNTCNIHILAQQFLWSVYFPKTLQKDSACYFFFSVFSTWGKPTPHGRPTSMLGTWMFPSRRRLTWYITHGQRDGKTMSRFFLKNEFLDFLAGKKMPAQKIKKCGGG